MLPIGPLMKEHRVIETVIGAIREQREHIGDDPEVAAAFVDTVADFFRTYADRCHHGKEEDILFARLKEKPLDDKQRATLERLIREHERGRELIKALLEAKARFVAGDRKGGEDVAALLGTLAEFYPKHIDTEDNHFFRPAMEAFSEDERNEMLSEYERFDAGLIHETYKEIAECLAQGSHAASLLR